MPYTIHLCTPLHNLFAKGVTASAKPVLRQLRAALGDDVPIVVLEGHTYVLHARKEMCVYMSNLYSDPTYISHTTLGIPSHILFLLLLLFLFFSSPSPSLHFFYLFSFFSSSSPSPSLLPPSSPPLGIRTRGFFPQCGTGRRRSGLRRRRRSTRS